MKDQWVAAMWWLVGGYLAVGCAFAVPFVLRWCGRLDPSAAHGNWGFRLVIFPGVAALWPILLRRLLKQGSPVPPDAEAAASAAFLRRLHGRAFRALAVIIPVLFVVALVTRPDPQSSKIALQPAALPGDRALSAVNGLPVQLSVRGPGPGAQVELLVTAPLAEPMVALYWNPESGKETVGPDSVFLGSVWGPSKLVFPLPDRAPPGAGNLVFLSLSGDQRVLASVSLNPPTGSP